MFNYLQEYFLDHYYGEKFEISQNKINEYMEVKKSLCGFPFNGVPSITIVGDRVNFMTAQLYPQQRYTDNRMTDKGIGNIILPMAAFSFFKNHGTLEDISAYEAVKNHGMLYGQKRRLVTRG
jgi:hypothetical protein